MDKAVQEVYEKAQELHEKFGDEELRDFILTLAAKIEQAEILRHHFGYFLMHAQAVIPYDARPRHFRDALERAKKVLAAYE